MAHDDDHGNIVILKTVLVAVRAQEIICKSKRIPQPIWGGRIKYHPVLTGYFLQPIVLLVPLRLPGRRGRRLAVTSYCAPRHRSCKGRDAAAQTSEKRPPFRG